MTAPMAHTKGMTANARAVTESDGLFLWSPETKLTLVLGVDRDLANHGLNNTHIPVQDATNRPSEKSHPEICGEADYQQRHNSACAAEEQHRFTSYSV